ncbi:MAG: Gfo/Idh/MocA family protein, partial [Verrucomicrobiales bacterium]
MRKKVIVLGAGNMGASHARAYHNLDGFEIAGIVTRSAESREKLADSLGGDIPCFGDYREALNTLRPDCVSINTYPDTHAEYAIAAMEAGAHVFLEKPLAPTVDEAQKVVDTATRLNKKLCIGYILRHHPSWIKFIDIARTLGNPLVMRMNLNQQSH